MRIFIVGLFYLISCLASHANEIAKELLFVSVGNDSAHIELTFYKNKTFELKFQSLDDKNPSYLRGNWAEQKNVYDFTIKEFGEFKKSIIDKFFGVPGNTTLTKIKVNDEHRYRFNKDTKNIKLWDIVCERKLPVEANAK